MYYSIQLLILLVHVGRKKYFLKVRLKSKIFINEVHKSNNNFCQRVSWLQNYIHATFS